MDPIEIIVIGAFLLIMFTAFIVVPTIIIRDIIKVVREDGDDGRGGA